MVKKIWDKFKANPEYFVFVYFVLITVPLAYSLKSSIVPDESVHMLSIGFYAQHFPNMFIDSQTSAFAAGELLRTGQFMYYYLMAPLYLALQSIDLNPLIPIRFVSVVASVGTLFYLSKIGIELKLPRSLKVTLLFLVASMPMFVFMSAGVNYDAITIFLSTFLAYLILSLYREFNINKFILALSLVFFGPMIKLAFAPISVVAGLYLIVLLFQKNKNNNLINLAKIQYKKTRVLTISVGVLFVLCFLIFGAKYGNNLQDYGTVKPKCDQVLSVDDCNKNFVYKRSEVYRNAELETPDVKMVSYVASWTEIMNSRIYGILAHKKFSQNDLIISMSMVLLGVLMVALIRGFRFRWSHWYLLVSFLFYSAVLINSNIAAYKRSQEIDLAVQGRYWFPVLFLFIFFVVSLHNKFLNKNLKSFGYKALLLTLIIFAFFAGAPNIKNGTNEAWYRSDGIPTFYR